MRTMNGQFTNRLPAQEAANTAADIGKNLGGAALQAVVIVAAVRAFDAVFNAIISKHQARRARTATDE